jgi:hypothetical protein
MIAAGSDFTPSPLDYLDAIFSQPPRTVRSWGDYPLQLKPSGQFSVLRLLTKPRGRTDDADRRVSVLRLRDREPLLALGHWEFPCSDRDVFDLHDSKFRTPDMPLKSGQNWGFRVRT